MSKIPIVEGHNNLDYYWIRPVSFDDKPGYAGVSEMDDEISIKKEYFDSFLLCFFTKYFDSKLEPNTSRRSSDGRPGKFDDCMEYNFYTQKTMYDLLNEIDDIADMLENEKDNIDLNDTKNHILWNTRKYTFRQNDSKNPDDDMKITDILDFFFRFIERMNQMLDMNPEAEFITVMGP